MKILISLMASMFGFLGFSKSETLEKQDILREGEFLNFDFEILEEPLNSIELTESPSCLPAIICIICTTLGSCLSVICLSLGGCDKVLKA